MFVWPTKGKKIYTVKLALPTNPINRATVYAGQNSKVPSNTSVRLVILLFYKPGARLTRAPTSQYGL